MTDILTHSALYQELKDFPESPDISEPITNRVIMALATKGLCQSELFRYTRAVPNGFIHACLQGVSLDDLMTAKELVEFWQFPVSWSVAIDEEVALKIFLTTGFLPPILVEKAKEITNRITRIILYTQIFAAQSDNDIYLGRKYSHASSLVVYLAACSGYIELVSWLYDNGATFGTDACAGAAFGGHLHILKWLREHGCPWNVWTCLHAASNGYLEILTWAIKNGCVWNNRMGAAYAAEMGHIHVLQWLKDQGYPMYPNIYFYAAKKGRLPVIQWAYKQGIPIDETDAVTHEYSHILDLVRTT